MSVSSELNKISYVAAGSSTYPIPFAFTEDAHIQLYINDVKKTLGTHYTVTGKGNPSGGTLSIVGALPTPGHKVVILRVVPLTQPNSFTENGPFRAKTMESMFDRATHIDQQINESLSRAVKFPLASTVNPQLEGDIVPDAMLVINDDGTGLAFGPSYLTFSQDASGAVLAAEAAKDAAEAAAANAAQDVVDTLTNTITLAEEILTNTGILMDATEEFKNDAQTLSEAAFASAQAAGTAAGASADSAAEAALSAAEAAASAGSPEVVNSTAGSEIDKAASVAAMKSYITATPTTPLDDSVSAAKIKTDAVTTIKIQNSAVTNSKIANASVTPAKLSAGFLERAFVYDSKTAGTHGGTSSSATWHTRALNASDNGAIIGMALASNQVTLAAGRYIIKAAAPAFVANRHKLRLRNITDSSTAISGQNSYAGDANTITHAFLNGEINIASTKVFELQHYIELGNANGLGLAISQGAEVYAHIEIQKLS